MENKIESIFLDVGNTLRIVILDQEFMAQAKKDMVEFAFNTGWRISEIRKRCHLLASSHVPQSRLIFGDGD